MKDIPRRALREYGHLEEEEAATKRMEGRQDEQGGESDGEESAKIKEETWTVGKTFTFPRPVHFELGARFVRLPGVSRAHHWVERVKPSAT